MDLLPAIAWVAVFCLVAALLAYALTRVGDR
jgi:hypothetical protein